MAADPRPIFVTVDPETLAPRKPTLDAIEAEIVTPHEEDQNPHSAYDDAPSFALIFENGLA